MSSLQILNTPFSYQGRSTLFRLADHVVFHVFLTALFDFTVSFDETCFHALHLTCKRAYVILNPILHYRIKILQPPTILVKEMDEVAQNGFPIERLFREALSKTEKRYHELYTEAGPEIYDPLIHWLQSLSQSIRQISALAICFTTGGKTGTGGVEKPLEVIRLLPHISSIAINDYEAGAQCKLNDSVLSEVAQTCYRLECVVLRGCKHFTNVGLANLLQKHALFLKKLDLHQCVKVDFKQEELLKELSFPCLVSLCLPYNVNKEGLLIIVSRAPQLRQLAIRSSSKLDASDIEEVIRAGNLATIDLSDGLKLESTDIDQLKLIFPQVKFIY
ncbi:MAG: hypothetical protein KDK96_11435 [Chlamydiia bacterium]|nr:hypothetical protein [Chlamydiia bacterium]